MSEAGRLLTEASRRLAAAGVPSPDYDAGELLARATGSSRAAVRGLDVVTEGARSRFEELVSRRERREPLQHLLGTAAFRYVEVSVGPGVFVPRPETELLAGWAVDQARRVEHPDGAVVVDLGTGSGAIALSVATEVPSARVYAAELDPVAMTWAEANLTGSGVRLWHGDLAEAFPELDGLVDVVVSNPPYIPLGAWESVAIEARDHDPATALWSGEDGLDAIRAVERRAGRLLRVGGSVGVEHADLQGRSAPGVFSASGRWRDVGDHQDLAGRPRFLTARRSC